MTYRSDRPRGFVAAAFTVLALSSPGAAWAASETVELVATASFFATVVAVAAMAMVAHHRRTLQRHQTLRAMVDKGVTIEPQLLEDRPRPANPRRDLRWGILLISAGLGIVLFVAIEDGIKDAAIGLVPIFLGLGYLIVAKLEWSHPPTPEPSQI